MDERDILLEVKNLKVRFPMREGTVNAVNGVDFTLKRGQTLGVVGESGCGKSVTARAILGIVPAPGEIGEGEILYHRGNSDEQPNGTVPITSLDTRGKEIRAIRGAEIAMVFQEPMASLSPVHTIGNQIIEAIRLHQNVDWRTARQQAIETLDLVGMPKAVENVDSYPHQLSGGMRQRAVIAMALSCRPTLLIADEPTTALDVTTEAQILDLMRDLQEQFGMAILYITHNLGVIAEMTERVIVMYLGRIVEEADVDTIFFNPKHPYTKALLASMPRLGHKSNERLQVIEGAVPDPYSVPKGCPFHPRCAEHMPGICDQVMPKRIQIADGHTALCHLYDESMMNSV